MCCHEFDSSWLTLNSSHVVVAAARTRTTVAREVLMAQLGNYKGSGNSRGGRVAEVMVVVQGEELSFSSSFLTRT